MERSLRALLEPVGRGVRSRVVSERVKAVRCRGRWVMLPPVPTAAAENKSLLHIVQQPKAVSAIAWLKQCCPQISQNDAEALFRSCQVKVCGAASQTSDLKQAKLKRVARKDILPEGSVLLLPKGSLEFMNIYHPGRRLNKISDGYCSPSDCTSKTEEEQ